MTSRHEQIRQCRHNEQAIAILHHAAVADLGKAKDAFDDEEGVLNLGTHARLSAVLLLLRFGESPVTKPLLVGEVMRLGCGLGDQLLLAGVDGVAIHSLFVAMQQLRDAVLVMLVGRRGHHRVDQPGLAIHADMSLHAEVPLVPLLGLMKLLAIRLGCQKTTAKSLVMVHLRVARLVLILGGGRCTDNRRIHNGAGRDLQPLGLQMPTDFLEQVLAKFMLFQQMAELAHGGFVRSAFPPRIDTNQFAHGHGVVQSFFHRRVGQVEPVLQKVDAQHTLKPHRRTSVSGFRIKGLNQGTQDSPRHDSIHLGQKRCASRHLAVEIKAARTECRSVHRSVHRSVPFVQSSLLITCSKIVQDLIRDSLSNI
jgi:hypothetical protein